MLLHHLPLSPGCRKVRLALAEKKLEVDMRVEPIWRRNPAFLTKNPAGEVPVLDDPGGEAPHRKAAIVSGAQVICEYLDELWFPGALMGTNPTLRAEVRRLIDWFDGKYQVEVGRNLVDEKIMKRFLRLGAPDARAIRAGKKNIHTHLDYIGWLTERRGWLAGRSMTLADLTAAAHLSCADYLGDVPWEDHAEAKDWYARIKSRPAFRPLLDDSIPGIPPPAHYKNLDF